MKTKTAVNLIILLAVITVAIVFLKLTYVVILTAMAVLQTLAIASIFFFCGYQLVKRFMPKERRS